MGKVFPALVDKAIENAPDLQSVYSWCVKLWYRSTGKFDCGFSAREMVKWIRENRADIFDDRGHKISPPQEVQP